MRIKPIHILAYTCWLNFFAMCWMVLLRQAPNMSAVEGGIGIILFFLLSVATSAASVEKNETE